MTAATADLLVLVKRAATDDAIGREALLDVFRAVRPRSSFVSGRACDDARNRFVQLWEIGAPLDAAMTLATALPGLLEVTGGWEPDQPDVYPAWTLRWYPRGTSGAGWHAAIETAATPGLALLATVLETAGRAIPPQCEGDSVAGEGV